METDHPMESPQQQLPSDRPLPHQLEVIQNNINELVSAVFSSNDAAVSAFSKSPQSVEDAAALRTHQANAIQTFRDLMIEVQRKTSKAIHEVELKLGPSAAGYATNDGVTDDDALLQDLPGVKLDSELYRTLGRMELHGKQSYKLRDIVTAHLPASIIVPQIIVADDGAGNAMAPPYANNSGEGNHVVVLQPTLRNVWVVQHAYTKLLNYKEGLIAQYLKEVIADSSADPSKAGGGSTTGPPPSRKFAREFYEVPGLANLPSKNKLGNLLDVKSSTYHSDATGDIMIVLVSTSPSSDGSLTFTEAVTGELVTAATTTDNGINESAAHHLILPVAEASIRKLYDAYRALRKATSEQRRASRDKAFAATLPVDEVAQLEMQFEFGGAGAGAGAGADGPGENASGRKRRRMLDDED